ncbi:sulfur carrier protein ThiS [Candidatus Poribacteria bacterium]|nr:sulfur carrier protein ThiS [Candidatus Poribacteria bacterium]
MTITVNGRATELRDSTTVESLVAATVESVPERGIAVAVNGAVVRRAEWHGLLLREGDCVEIIRAVQGGI